MKPRQSASDEKVHFDAKSFDIIKYDEKKIHKQHITGYMVFAHIERYSEYESRLADHEETHAMRMIFNFKPESILSVETGSNKPCVLQKMIDEFMNLPYVQGCKVEDKFKYACNHDANVFLYFNNPPGSGNLEDMIERASAFAEYTRPGHESGAQPISSDTPGITWADDCYNEHEHYSQDKQRKSFAYGRTRVERVALAIVDTFVAKEEVTFENVVQRLDEKLKNHPYPIDPEYPHLCMKHAKQMMGEE